MRRPSLPVLALVLVFAVAALVPAAGAEEPPKKKKEAPNPRVLIKTSMGDITAELLPKVAPRTVEIFLGLAKGEGQYTDVKTPAKKVRITRPFYDGLGFHRVMKNFMIQGGCPMGNGTGDAGFKFADEINAKRLGLGKHKVLQGGRPHQWLGVRTTVDWRRNVLIPVLKAMKINPADTNAQKARQNDIKAKLDSLTLLELYEILGYKFSTTLPSIPPKRGCLALANAGPNTNGSQFFINLIDTPWLTGKHTVFGRVVAGMDVVDKIGGVKVGAGSKPVTPVKIVSIRPVVEKAIR